MDYPSVEQLTAELKRVKYRSRYRAVLRSTLYMLIVVAAVAVLVATIWMPVLQIYGASMTPTLSEGDIVVSIKGSDFQPGDLVALPVPVSGWISTKTETSLWTASCWRSPI